MGEPKLHQAKGDTKLMENKKDERLRVLFPCEGLGGGGLYAQIEITSDGIVIRNGYRRLSGLYKGGDPEDQTLIRTMPAYDLGIKFPFHVSPGEMVLQGYMDDPHVDSPFPLTPENVGRWWVERE